MVDKGFFSNNENIVAVFVDDFPFDRFITIPMPAIEIKALAILFGIGFIRVFLFEEGLHGFIDRALRVRSKKELVILHP